MRPFIVLHSLYLARLYKLSAMENNSMYYSEYLGLDKVLSSQNPASFNAPNQPAHDEMLFIIIHQAYELWFKQILFELDFVMGVFAKEKINDNSEDLNLVRHRLKRITTILDLLTQQVGILDTMTPLDFLEFRNLLTPSSGFQSLQFRLIETRLGLKMEKRHHCDYYKRTNEGGFNPSDYDTLSETESKPDLLLLVNQWLERMPFFNEAYWKDFSNKPDNGFHPFWNAYRKIYAGGLTEKEHSKIKDFDYTFFEKTNTDLTDEQKEQLRINLSPAAMRAGLFIMLYRDFPVFQTSYQILDSLIEIDHKMSDWRHKHFIMVRRMIGMRVGTGNTSGRGYLEGAMNKHFVYKDIAGLSTYLIERRKLPDLPVELTRNLSFAM